MHITSEFQWLNDHHLHVIYLSKLHSYWNNFLQAVLSAARYGLQTSQLGSCCEVLLLYKPIYLARVDDMRDEGAIWELNVNRCS